MLKNDETRYGLVSRLLHWGMALLIIGMIILGVVMADMAKDDPLRPKLFDAHMAFGVLVFLLAVVRSVWLRISPAPPEPTVLIDWERNLALVVRSLMYLLMLLVPLAGYTMAVYAGHSVSFFGLFHLPLPFAKSHDMHEVFEGAHKALAWSLAVLIVLHIVGALKHKYMDLGEGDVMKRML